MVQDQGCGLNGGPEVLITYLSEVVDFSQSLVVSADCRGMG